MPPDSCEKSFHSESCDLIHHSPIFFLGIAITLSDVLMQALKVQWLLEYVRQQVINIDDLL